MDNPQCIGVVTVTYNSATVLEDFMRSMLLQAHVSWRLYVIDNASSDATRKMLGAYADERIRCVFNKENLGVATGNNQGIRAALADGCAAVLLLNNDTVFGPELFAGLLATQMRTKAEMVVPKMMFFEPKDRIWCAGGRFNRLRGYSAVHFGEGEVDRGQRDDSGNVEYCPTCCMLIAPKTFEIVGLMDDAYFVYWDDADFCYRAKVAGLKIYYDHRMVLRHKVSALTGGAASDFSIRYYTRNKIYFLLKHFYFLALFHVISYEVYLFFRPWRPVAVWKLRQKSFFEGFRMFFSRSANSNYAKLTEGSR